MNNFKTKKIMNTLSKALLVLALLLTFSCEDDDPITITDETPPVVTLNGGNDVITLAVGQPYIELGATATDNIDGDISEFITIIVRHDDGTQPAIIDTSAPNEYWVGYFSIDASGNNGEAFRRLEVVGKSE
jgi:hypothetical protein